MPRFFAEYAGADGADTIVITGGDAGHISQSLRMRPGEKLTVSNGMGTDFDCTIVSACPDEVLLSIDRRYASVSEPDVRVTLYQGFPKGDKLETVIEKAVELGVYRIVPVLTERSVARPDEKAAAKRLERWRRHACEAAKQCGRGIIPEVEPLTVFDKAGDMISSHRLRLFFYELGGVPLQDAVGCAVPGKTASATEGTDVPEAPGVKSTGVPPPARDIGIFIGPEGGISSEEARRLREWGALPVTLGKRILRTETAPIAALAGIMLLTGNLE